MKHAVTHSSSLSFDRPLKGRFATVLKAVFIVAVAVIIYESLIPASSSSVSTHFDKIVHFGAYFVLVVLGLLAFPKTRLMWIVWPMIALGGGLEAAQGLMNLGRSASLGDMVANILGAGSPACFWVIYLWLTASPDK